MLFLSSLNACCVIDTLPADPPTVTDTFAVEIEEVFNPTSSPPFTIIEYVNLFD